MYDKEYKNCKILKIYRRIMKNIGEINEYLVEIEIDDENISKHISIKIDKCNLYQELEELLKGKRKRIYASHGMTDIDIYKFNDKYCIEWSPHDCSYSCFFFDRDNFENNFVNALKPQKES